MNLRGLANSLTSAVNPNITAQLFASAGYTTTDSGKRVPAYAEPVPAIVQVQALSAPEIAHLDGLNIQGVLRKVFLDGDWRGVFRPENQGGDLFQFTNPQTAVLQEWLVVQVLETWPDWCSLAVQLQRGLTT